MPSSFLFFLIGLYWENTFFLSYWASISMHLAYLGGLSGQVIWETPLLLLTSRLGLSMPISIQQCSKLAEKDQKLQRFEKAHAFPESQVSLPISALVLKQNFQILRTEHSLMSLPESPWVKTVPKCGWSSHPFKASSSGRSVTSVRIWGSPISLYVMESSWTLSTNLRVSQQMMTGRCMAWAASATLADPVLAMIVPFERAPDAPMNTFVTSYKPWQYVTPRPKPSAKTLFQRDVICWHCFCRSPSLVRGKFVCHSSEHCQEILGQILGHSQGSLLRFLS